MEGLKSIVTPPPLSANIADMLNGVHTWVGSTPWKITSKWQYEAYGFNGGLKIYCAHPFGEYRRYAQWGSYLGRQHAMEERGRSHLQEITL